MSKGFIPDKLKLSKPLPDNIRGIIAFGGCYGSNVELFTCPDIHLIIHAWSRVHGLIFNLSQVVEIMLKGCERLCQLQ